MVINNVAGCCPVGVNCGGEAPSSSTKGSPATVTENAAAPTTTSAAAQTASSAAAPAQGGCSTGFISCTDGTGGCCPSGSQVSESRNGC